MSSRGRFITLEGGEGVGKSTQLKAMSRKLSELGIACVETREPGGSPGAEAIRALLLDPDSARWSAPAEALLFAAARSDHVEKTILPALERGQWVLSDRFLDSSIAYQGHAGGLGAETIRQLHRIGSDDCLPDRTILLIDPQGADRARLRDGQKADRIGGRSAEYHRDVENAFRAIAEREPERVRICEAGGSIEDVTARIFDIIADLLP